MKLHLCSFATFKIIKEESYPKNLVKIIPLINIEDDSRV